MAAARQKAKLLKTFPIQVRFMWMDSDLKTKSAITSHVPKYFRGSIEHMVHQETTLFEVMREFETSRRLNFMTVFDVERNGVCVWMRGDIASPGHIKVGARCKTLIISILPLRVRFIREGETTEKVVFKECMRLHGGTIMDFLKHDALPEYKKRFLPKGMTIAKIKVSGQSFTLNASVPIRNPTRVCIDDYQTLSLRISHQPAPIEQLAQSIDTTSFLPATEQLQQEHEALPLVSDHCTPDVMFQPIDINRVNASPIVDHHGIDVADLFAHVTQLIQDVLREDAGMDNEMLIMRVKMRLCPWEEGELAQDTVTAVYS